MYIREPFPYTRLKIREALGLEDKFSRLDCWETLQKILHDGCSVSRYGDGELSYFLKKRSLRFQPYYPDLGERLREAIMIPKPGVLTCFNNVFQEPIRLDRVREHRSYIERWIRIGRKTKVELFGDARCFRLSNCMEGHGQDCLDQVKDDFRALFRGRRILFVCPETPLGGESFQALEPRLRQIGLSDAQYIFIPNIDAAAVEDDIRRQIAMKSGYDDIFIQAGPLATVLAYELAGTVDGRIVDAGALNNAVPFFTEESATTPA